MKIFNYGVVLFGFCLFSACSDAPKETVQSQSVKTPAPSTAPAAKVNIDPMARGKTLYKRCQACHTLEQGGRNKVGPNLWAIIGMQAGQNPEFNYSKVMAASDVIWTEEALSAYLEKPREFMPGNRMSFVGLRKPEDRDAVIAYIKRETTKP